MTNDPHSARDWRASSATHTTGQGTDAATSDGPQAERFYRIDEVARRTNLTKRTLRYYEELGLLAPAQRSEGNYRLYSASDIHRLEHIVAMRDLLGLELKEIREMVEAEMQRERIKAQWQSDSDPSWRLGALDEAEKVAQRELKLLVEKLAGLETMRETLLDRLATYQRLRSEIRAQIELAADTHASSHYADAHADTPAHDR